MLTAIIILTHRENIKRLINAYQSYFNFYSDDSWNLIICGSGDELIYLKNYVNDLDVKNLNKDRLKALLKGLYVEASNMEI